MNAAEVRANVVLSDWVGQRVRLRGPKGGWQFGLCPFHDDHHPSFAVHDGEGRWRCYACGIYGDVFDWLERTEGLTFQEALQRVCDAQGITYKVDKQEEQRRLERKTVVETLRNAITYFETCLTEDHRAFLREHYNLSDETISAFHLGFAHPAFVESMEALGYDRLALRHCGLLNANGRFTLEGRITIPYYWHRQPVYLSGRRIFDDGADARFKYLHLPLHERDPQVSPTIRKVLFNVDRLPRAQKVYIVEGVFDAMALQQRAWLLGGAVAVVSPSGSRLGDEYASLLRSYAPKAEIIVVPDGDQAGLEGAMDTVATLFDTAAFPLVWVLPVGKDPASLGDDIFDVPAPITPAHALLRLLGSPSPQEAENLFVTKAVPLLSRYPKTQQDEAIDVVAAGWGMHVQTLRNVLRMHERTGVDGIERSPAGAILLEFFEPLAYQQTERTTSIVLWSRRREAPVHVDLQSTRAAYGALAPHVGDLEKILRERLPDVDAKDRHAGLVNAMYQMSWRLPRWEDMQVMRSGLHMAGDGSLVIIGHEQILIKEPGKPWRAADGCVHGEKLMIRNFSEKRPWFDFSVGEANRPLDIPLEDAYELLLALLRKGWAWTAEEDAELWALNCFALTWSTLWDVMPWHHITAPASSGKSTLCEGFLGGRGLFASMGGPFIVTAAAEEDPTEAAVRAKYSDTMRVLIMDEFEESEKNVQRLLRMMRTSRTGGGSIRGTQEGGFRESFLNNPLILSSIGAVTSDADASRLTVTRLAHQRGFPSPPVTCREFWESRKINPRDIRRTILFGFADRAAEMQAFYRELASQVLPGEEASSPRGKENLLPAIVSAHFLGLDWREASRRLFHAHTADQQDLDVGSREVAFEDNLLNRSFAYVGPDGKVAPTTVWAMRGAKPEHTVPYGFWWHSKLPHTLYCYGVNLVTRGPLSGLYEPQIRTLNAIMRECPHYLRTEITAKAGGPGTRWCVFDFADLAADHDSLPQ